MNRIHDAWQRARRRQWWITIALLLPLALAITAITARVAGISIASVALLATLLVVAGTATWRARRLDRHWLVRQLDRHAITQDSADLLFADTATLNPLQQRQQARVTAALQAAPPDLRAAWPKRWLALSWAGGMLVAVLAVGWPAPGASLPVVPGHATPAASVAQPPSLQSSTLKIQAPNYTGQALRT
ncbi:MAG: hypothetical protein ACREPC_14580, partial [Stenotrophomonas sp.]